jgi:hypothetical protein
MKVDLTYIQDGMFTTFLVNSDEGLPAYKELIRVLGAPKVLNQHLPQTLAQLKAAGYGVRKSTAKPKGIESFTESDKKLLDLLTA